MCLSVVWFARSFIFQGCIQTSVNAEFVLKDIRKVSKFGICFVCLFVFQRYEFTNADTEAGVWSIAGVFVPGLDRILCENDKVRQTAISLLFHSLTLRTSTTATTKPNQTDQTKKKQISSL